MHGSMGGFRKERPEGDWNITKELAMCREVWKLAIHVQGSVEVS